MARGSLAGLSSVVREAIDPGAGWQEVPCAHQGMEREVRVGRRFSLRTADPSDWALETTTAPNRRISPRISTYI